MNFSARYLVLFCLGALLAQPSLVSANENLSQFIRSNSEKYWKFATSRSSRHGIGRFLKFDGVVAGDPHLGNFGVISVPDSSGVRKMKYVMIDFDDSGRAPFVLDFAYLVITSEAASIEVKKKDLVAAYIKGLKGIKINPPKEVREYLSMGVKEYQRREDDLVDSQTKGDRFKRKKGKLEEYHGAISRKMIEKLLPEQEILDVVRRVVERGGSSEQLRLWVLARASGRNQIIELKEFARPAVSAYQDQLSPGPWLKEVQAVFWPKLDSSVYTLKRIDAETAFWIRPKRVQLIDVPYSSEKPERIRFLRDLADLAANALGLAHGAQKSGPRFLAEIESDEKEFRAVLKEFADQYIDHAKKILKD